MMSGRCGRCYGTRLDDGAGGARCPHCSRARLQTHADSSPDVSYQDRGNVAALAAPAAYNLERAPTVPGAHMSVTGKGKERLRRAALNIERNHTLMAIEFRMSSTVAGDRIAEMSTGEKEVVEQAMRGKVLSGRREEKVMKRVKEVLDRLSRTSGGLDPDKLLGMCMRIYGALMRAKEDAPQRTGRASRAKRSRFSVSRDVDVVTASLIILAAGRTPGLCGGVMDKQVCRALGPGGEAKLGQVANFRRMVQAANALADIPQVEGASMGEYVETMVRICNSRNIPQGISLAAREVAEEAIRGAWLRGRHPDNALAAAFVHVVNQCERYTEAVARALRLTADVDADSVPAVDLSDEVAVFEFAREEFGGLNTQSLIECVNLVDEMHVCHQRGKRKKKRKRLPVE